MLTEFSLTHKFDTTEDLESYAEEAEAYIEEQTHATVEIGFWKEGLSLRVDVVAHFEGQDITPILRDLLSEID